MANFKSATLFSTCALLSLVASPSEARDVLQAGPGGQTIIYFAEGSDVVIRRCADEYKIVKTRNDCTAAGPENRIPAEKFKRILAATYYLPGSEDTTSLNASDIIAFKMGDAGRNAAGKREFEAAESKIYELQTKLVKIIQFQEEYGPDPKLSEDYRQALSALSELKNNSSVRDARILNAAVDRINFHVERIVQEQIADSSKVHSASMRKGSGMETFAVLSRLDASRPECGIRETLGGSRGSEPEKSKPQGNPAAAPGAWLLNHLSMVAYARSPEDPIEPKIKDCAGFPGSSKVTSANVRWDLVSRRREGSKYYEVWKDSRSGLVWTGVLDSEYTLDSAVEVSMNGEVLREKACSSPEGARAAAGITERQFGLPRAVELQEALKAGIDEVLTLPPSTSAWTKTVTGFTSGVSISFDKKAYPTDAENRRVNERATSMKRVLCVGRSR